MIPADFTQSLLQRVNIVEVIERHLTLRKAGRNYQACCPFHQEKTPSFSVNSDKQFFYCFGCGVGGNAINFVMRMESLSFTEAVEELARMAGMSVPKRASAQPSRLTLLSNHLARAATVYRTQLNSSNKAQEYLRERGVSHEVAERFALGYATDNWQGLKASFPDYESRDLEDCGLVVKNENGRRYDRFRDRLMFPIVDSRSQVMGFGARTMGTDEPKYLNSPQTPVFEKGRELYGLPQARNAIRHKGMVVVVEGYMDVLSLSQMGVEECVATLGTATSEHQVGRLLQLAPTLVFCFDGDKAGRAAAWRALNSCLPVVGDTHTVGFVFLPEAEDPDSFIRAKGEALFRQKMAEHERLSEFLLRHLQEEHPINSSEGKAQFLRAAEPLIKAFAQAPALKMQLGKSVANLCGLEATELAQLWKMQGGVPGRMHYTRHTPARALRKSPPTLERVLLQMVLQDPSRAQRIALGDLTFSTPDGEALRALVEAAQLGELPAGALTGVLEYFRDTPHIEIMQARLGELLKEEEEVSDEAFTDAIKRMLASCITRQIEDINRRIKDGKMSNKEGGEALVCLLNRRRELEESSP